VKTARHPRSTSPDVRAVEAALLTLSDPEPLHAPDVRRLLAALVRAAGIDPFEYATLSVRIPGHMLASVTVGGRRWEPPPPPIRKPR
jgi:hypothetical protein